MGVNRLARRCTLRDCGRELSRKELSGWQDQLAVQLPRDYVEFLIHFNGGCFYPRSIGGPTYSTNSMAHTDAIGLLQLFHLNEPWNSTDLIYVNKTHKGRIPATSIAISSTANDLLLLDRNGKVLLWERDREAEADIAKDPSTIVSVISETFAQFLDGIQPRSRKERELDWTFPKLAEPELSIAVGDCDVVRTWIEQYGAERALKQAGSDLLCAAVRYENFECALWLLDSGIDVQAENRQNELPIQIAERTSCGDLVVLLLERGADPKDFYRSGHKPQKYILDFVKQWQDGQRTSVAGPPRQKDFQNEHA